MYQNYIITVDEHGEPYIAHWFGLGHRNPPRNHKYVARIETPKGVRYFYTKADLYAYQLRQKVKGKVKNLFRRKKSTTHVETQTTSKPPVQTSSQTTTQAPQQPTVVTQTHVQGRPTSHRKLVTGKAKPGSLKRHETVSEMQLGSSSYTELAAAHKTAVANYEKAQKAHEDALKAYGRAFDTYTAARDSGASEETLAELKRRRDRAHDNVATYEKAMKAAGRKVDEIEWEVKKRRPALIID